MTACPLRATLGHTQASVTDSPRGGASPVDVDRPVVADLVAEVATAVSRRAAEVSQDVCKLILREIPQLAEEEKQLLYAGTVIQRTGWRPA